MSNNFKFTLLGLSCAFLIGCGGGDGQTINKPQTSIPSVNVAPKAVLEAAKNNIYMVNKPLKFSAAKSTDENKDKLTYQWILDKKPQDSKLTLNVSSKVDLEIIPDSIGDYNLRLIISDGKLEHSQDIQFSVMPSMNVLQLTFKPSIIEYSQASNTLVGFDDETDILYLINGTTGKNAKIPLSDDITRLKVSPNGKIAIALHANHISYIDIANQKIIQVFENDGPYTDVFALDNKIAYLLGQENGQWTSNGIVKLDLVSGNKKAQLQNTNQYLSIWGDIKGIYSGKKNKIFYLDYGLSPQHLFAINLDSNNNAISHHDSPYHGDYEFGTEIFLDQLENYIFSSSGNYFRTSDMKYSGRLKLTENEKIIQLLDMSEQKKLVSLNTPYQYLNQPTVTYLPYYYEYSDIAYSKVKLVPLPVIGEQQTYAKTAFLDDQDNLTIIAQAGSNNANGTKLAYYWITFN